MVASFLKVFIIFLVSQQLYSQEPHWIKKPPKASNDTYYFKVEYGIGYTEQKARNDAFLHVLQNASNALGIAYDSRSVNEAILNNTSLEIISLENNLPIHKVCEFSSKSEGKYRVYVLFQIARSGNIVPHFDEYRGCNKTGINIQPVWRSAIVPGWGQYYQKEQLKGTLFLGSEVLLIGATAFASIQSNLYMDKANGSFDIQTRKYYIDKSQNLSLFRNMFGIGVAAIWILNIIDASSNGNNRLASLRKNQFELFAASNQIGIKFHLH